MSIHTIQDHCCLEKVYYKSYHISIPFAYYYIYNSDIHICPFLDINFLQRGGYMDTLGRIRQYMEERGWTEYKLAKESGLSHSTISNMFCRQTAPSIPTLDAICSGFGITLAQFFSETGKAVELTEEQYRMFQQWAKLTPSQKELIAELIRNMK